MKCALQLLAFSLCEGAIAFGGFGYIHAVTRRCKSFPFCSYRQMNLLATVADDTAVETTDIFMPALSSTMTEGKIVSWLKSEGDEVSAGEAIMVVESDKADMDVEAFEDGFLAKIITNEGETAEVGALVGIIVEKEEDISKVSIASEAPAGTTEKVTEASSDETSAPVEVAAPECEFTQVDMPALSSTMKEGKIVSWLKTEGETVSSGEAIMVVESDKADMDVEAFEDGVLAAIITAEGDSCPVGSPVAIIAAEEKDVPALKSYAATLGGIAPAIPSPVTTETPSLKRPQGQPKVTPASSGPVMSGDRVVASPLAKKRAAELGLDLSTITGSGPGGRITGGDVEAAASSGIKAKAKDTVAATKKPSHTPAPGVVPATPTAKVLAKKAGIDIFTLFPGSGNFGRVTEDDVKAATGEKKATKRAAPGTQDSVELPDGVVPFTGMQKAVSNNMEATLSTPVFRVSREIFMDSFDSLYQSVKAKGVSVSALLSKAVGMAVEKHPIMNSAYDPSGGINFKGDINIAMAVAVDGGLITPTIRNANERNIMDIAENWRELVEKAKKGGLKPEDYQSGTFTISNLGMFGVKQFDAILPPGQGSILSIGTTEEVVVPDARAVLGLSTAKKMTVTLTCDHRQIYGADAALFLKTFAGIMEDKTETLML